MVRRSWHRRPQSEADSSSCPPYQDKWTRMLFRRSQKSSGGEGETIKKVFPGMTKKKMLFRRQSRPKEPSYEPQEEVQPYMHVVIEVPASPASSTSASSCVGDGKCRDDRTEETVPISEVALKAPLLPKDLDLKDDDVTPKKSNKEVLPKDLDLRDDDVTPKKSNKEEERGIPQIATVAELLNLYKPDLAKNQKRRSSTALPDWWKEPRVDCLPSTSSHGVPIKDARRKVQTKDVFANAFAPCGHPSSREESSKDLAQTHEVSSGNVLWAEVPKPEHVTREVNASQSSPTATLKELPPTKKAESSAGINKLAHTDQREDVLLPRETTKELRTIPPIATISLLAPKILGNPKLCTPTTTNSPRRSSTALPDWWKQRVQECREQQQRQQQQEDQQEIRRTTWHGTAKQTPAREHRSSVQAKDVSPPTPLSGGCAAPRSKSAFVRQASFAGDSDSESTPQELRLSTEPKSNLRKSLPTDVAFQNGSEVFRLDPNRSTLKRSPTANSGSGNRTYGNDRNEPDVPVSDASAPVKSAILSSESAPAWKEKVGKRLDLVQRNESISQPNALAAKVRRLGIWLPALLIAVLAAFAVRLVLVGSPSQLVVALNVCLR